MVKNHRNNDELNFYDVIISFMLWSPDKSKALAALAILFGPDTINRTIDYKRRFKDYQGWRCHLIAALDNAQEKVDHQVVLQEYEE